MALSVQKVREQDAIIDFKATLVSSDYAQELASWFSRTSQTVRLDGFRPGKAPLSVVQSRYADEANRAVINTIVDRALTTIDKEHKLRVAGQPKVTIEKADSKDGFECSISVECLPTIELKDFSSISCEELLIDISKKEVDDAVDALFKRYKSHEKEPKKDKAAWGDKATISIKEKGTPGKAQQQDITLAEDSDVTWLPLHQGIHGKSTGDNVDVKITYPKDFHEANVASKTFTYEINIEAIYAPITFKLDATFAKEFDCEDLDGLHKKMHETLKNDQKHLVGLYHKRQILDALNDQYKMPLPKSAVEFEFQQIWKKLQDEISAARTRGEKEDIDLAEIEVEYRQIAERRVKLGLLVSEIAKEYKVALTNEEIQREIMMEAMKYQNQMKEVVDYYIKNPRILEKLIAPALEDKVVDFVFEKSKKKQTQITVQDLPAKLKGVVPGYEDDDASASQKTSTTKAPKESTSDGKKTPAKKASTKEKGE
jgi:trigger factor